MVKSMFATALAAFACLFTSTSGSLFKLAGDDWPKSVAWEFMPPDPTRPEDWEKWWHEALAFKDFATKKISYDDSAYRHPSLKWAQKAIVAPQAMMHDTYLWDASSSQYTVDKFLGDLETRYGGIDSVLLWYPYPNLGVDDRNQYEFFRSLPGGVEGTKKLVKDFHDRGVSVLFPYNPWDVGTHDEGKSSFESIATLFESVGADGCNLDTMTPSYGEGRQWFAASKAAGYPMAFQPEGGVNFWDVAGGSHADIMYEVVTWAEHDENYTWPEGVPMGPTPKLVEQRHQFQIVDRWQLNKTVPLQTSFVTGAGYVSWENVWGIWVEHAPRYAEELRRWSTLSRAMLPLISNSEGDAAWFPFVPAARQPGLWLSLFQGTLEGRTAYYWPIINNLNVDYVNASAVEVPVFPDCEYIDLYHGTPLTMTMLGNGNASVSLSIEALGYGAILAIAKPRPAFVTELMKKMALMTAAPLKTLSTEVKVLPQRMVDNGHTKRALACPQGMVEIPAGDYTFYSNATIIEGRYHRGGGVQYPWEEGPHPEHTKAMAMPRFCMDKYLVTSAQFQEFQHETGYVPRDTSNFLRGWTSTGNATSGIKYLHPAGQAEVPVSWVDLTDARTYATWRGARLPDEWEWQYAAQGGDDTRVWPWGQTWVEANAPVPDHGRVMRGPDPTDAHPSGASPFGVEDLVGNLHQWTNEYHDEHTRSAVTKGGSYYQPIGEHSDYAPDEGSWYFPRIKALNQHNKLLLLSPGMDRSGGIGFRCVVDMVQLSK